MNGKLVLENGQIYKGSFLGKKAGTSGNVILQTAVVGYQEILTDPVNYGRIIVFTYPLIGNYGVAEKFDQSACPLANGFVIKEKSPIYSNWQAQDSFDNFVKKNNISCLQSIDTRTLTIALRENGEMTGAILPVEEDEKEWLKNKNRTADHIKIISARQITRISGKGHASLGLLDLGVTKNIMEQLIKISSRLILFPYNSRAQDILKSKIKALVISGGPENDAALPSMAKEISKVVGRIPILAYSTGHHLLTMALGGKIYKLKLGHHGVNYPVTSPGTLKGEITVQNHSFCLSKNSIKSKGVEITGYNLNDKTIEEMRSRKLRFISCQYYLNSPGLGEINPVLKEFISRYA